ncbi:carbohydrate kinase family protein [Streptomyces sp. CAU 1734]|uniref:carbohydrate kinase family protein n=1 Tax=Streptomyces sp. CAU 1734 TaxID=3140360 RepID=UPI0032616984
MPNRNAVNPDMVNAEMVNRSPDNGGVPGRTSARLPGPPAGGEPASRGGGSTLLVVGEVVTDVVAQYTAPLATGTDTVARIRFLPGGAGANAACWAARRGGAEVRLLGRVGRDERGRHEEELRAHGVRPCLTADTTAPTSTVIVLVDPAGERTFLTDGEAVRRMSSADWSPALLNGVGHLHVSGYLFFCESSLGLARLALRTARSRGIPVSVDPASAGFIDTLGADRLLAEYEGVDVLIPNLAEARSLTGLPGAAEAAVALSRRVPLVAVTLGPEGALIAEAGALVARVPAPAARPVDSTGAGDAFCGAFLAARLAGAGARAAAVEGCRAGAEAVSLIGGRPPRPDTARPAQ